MKEGFATALEKSLVGCHSCHLVCQGTAAHGQGEMICPRCGSVLHQRKPHSLSRAWALVMAAFIFYIPAMVLPITTVISLGKAQS
ncbi:MAG: paraquat-inducible protein A, partial [Syntrophobacterales bacterium]